MVGRLALPRPIAQAISLEKFCSYQSIRKNHETFPPQTICNIRYKQGFLIICSIVSKHTEITMMQCNKDSDAFSNRTSTEVKMAVKINNDAAVVYTS